MCNSADVTTLSFAHLIVNNLKLICLMDWLNTIFPAELLLCLYNRSSRFSYHLLHICTCRKFAGIRPHYLHMRNSLTLIDLFIN